MTTTQRSPVLLMEGSWDGRSDWIHRADESRLFSVSPPTALSPSLSCVCLYGVLSPSLSLVSLVCFTEQSPFLHFSVYTFVICSFLLLSFASLFSESLLLPHILSLYVCFWLCCMSTNCCGTGIGFKWVRGKKTQRHLMNGFSLDCKVDPSLRTELLPFTWSFFYSSPIYILASWFPYPQNNLRKLPKGQCQEVPRFSRFPQPSFA